MIRIRIKKILAQKESIRLEFKEASGGVPQSLYETICAFLNRSGGDIFLGVSDKGDIVGVNSDKADEMCSDIASTLNNNNKLSPPFLLFPQKFEWGGNIILHLQVPQSSRVHRLGGIVFDRSADGDFKVTDPLAIAELSNRKASYYSETRTYPFLTLDDLDPATLRKARNYIAGRKQEHPWLALDNEGFLQKAGLYQKDYKTGENCYNLACALLFGKEETIQSLLPQYKIDALLKRTQVDRYDDRLDIRINLIEAYPLLMEFVEKHLPDPFYMEKDVRISLREKIFREVVANFLVHREYTHAVPGRFIIYSDRVEAVNPCVPHFKGTINAENFLPFQKNPLISKFFLQLGWVEEIGSGIVNINRYLKKYSNVGRAEFIEDEIFKTIIWYKQPIKQVTGNAVKAEILRIPQKELNERHKNAIEYIKEKGSMTNKEYQQINNVHRNTAVKDLKLLIKQGKIIREGAGRSSIYRLI